ncbi:MAG: NAD+ synthase [Candidatus Omnitrophica bacterium]|nr:NAD+ synthase [Candidatus Omnitrophota bacterium]
MDRVRVAISQINPTVGDLKGNTDKILFCLKQAVKKDCDLVVFPELVITGYPPEDLLLKPHFIRENLRCLNVIASATKDIIAIVGFSDLHRNSVYNASAVLENKKVRAVYHKIKLPNYGVFDEKRYFEPGKDSAIIKARDFRFGINICEDIWASEDVLLKKTLQAAQFLINISASPYHVDKIKERQDILSKKAKKFKIPIVYCNLIGGQDELVFDGRSGVFNENGKLIAMAKPFEEDMLIVDLLLKPKKISRAKSIAIDYKIKNKKCALTKRGLAKRMSQIEEIYSALALGVHDYVKKNNFSKVMLGLSGGIDSALVACIAVDALGKANVLALSMPSRYSSVETQLDAERLSRNLGIRFVKIPIGGIFDAYTSTLGSHFAGMQSDVTEENLQARIRGNILMAFSNKFGYLLLNTGNKSETSVGYCTLYGDMAGGFSVIKDVPKNLVYALARFRNKKSEKEIIPEAILKRPPSAELRPNQKDQDTLPPYDILDEIINLYIERDMSFADIVKKVKDRGLVKKVLKMIDVNEYKRRQSPPGIKIMPRSFGRDRRMPITNKYNEAATYGT